MPYYFVAKTPNGKFVGQFEVETIRILVARGKISPEDVATESIGTYAEVAEHGKVKWATVSSLLAGQPSVVMNETAPTLPQESSTAIGLRAILGFQAYVVCGAMGLVVTPNFGPGIFPLLLLVICSSYLATARKFRGFALGVFIGVGLTLLGIGVCFLTFKSGGP
jgi:hypothetical protein